ncbi:aldehyde dehydrogenase family protein [Larkinella sp. VNQ87]|uniref:aldehyde dehydrogenase family protein n=1 Tax=Larkinella sp. VNQ87 TaxID=3400921 RepID=UPI003C07549E
MIDETADLETAARRVAWGKWIHSRKESAIQFWLDRTTAGNTVINDMMAHFAHTELPVGGVNQSGIGKANGCYGFQEFSNARGIVRRQIDTLKYIYPPYSEQVMRIIQLILKYL